MQNYMLCKSSKEAKLLKFKENDDLKQRELIGIRLYTV